MNDILQNHSPQSPDNASVAPVALQAPTKQCTSCGATQTPMWRRGPNGTSTLCNACGVRWSAKQRLVGEKTSTNKGQASESDNTENYWWCKYCQLTWPKSHFKSRQQFGAHCSNCSRKRKEEAAMDMSTAPPPAKRRKIYSNQSPSGSPTLPAMTPDDSDSETNDSASSILHQLLNIVNTELEEEKKVSTVHGDLKNLRMLLSEFDVCLEGISQIAFATSAQFLNATTKGLSGICRLNPQLTAPKPVTTNSLVPDEKPTSLINYLVKLVPSLETNNLWPQSNMGNMQPLVNTNAPPPHKAYYPLPVDNMISGGVNSALPGGIAVEMDNIAQHFKQFSAFNSNSIRGLPFLSSKLDELQGLYSYGIQQINTSFQVGLAKLNTVNKTHVPEFVATLAREHHALLAQLLNNIAKYAAAMQEEIRLKIFNISDTVGSTLETHIELPLLENANCVRKGILSAVEQVELKIARLNTLANQLIDKCV